MLQSMLNVFFPIFRKQVKSNNHIHNTSSLHLRNVIDILVHHIFQLKQIVKIIIINSAFELTPYQKYSGVEA